jgi:hypothetical protein
MGFHVERPPLWRVPPWSLPFTPQLVNKLIFWPRFRAGA